MIGGLLGAAVGLALCALGLTDGWWVLWVGLAGLGIEGLARLRLEPGGDGGDWSPATGYGGWGT
jgi:hypothetical protein